MNERIRDLAITGGIYDCICDPYDKLKNGDPYSSVMIDLERFAEKIVRECIDKITTYDLVPGHSAKWEDIYDIHARLLQDLGEELKEHFGVTK